MTTLVPVDYAGRNDDELVLTFDVEAGTAWALHRTAQTEAVDGLLGAVGARVERRRASVVTEEADGFYGTIQPWVPGGAVRLGPFLDYEAAVAAEVVYLRARGL